MSAPPVEIQVNGEARMAADEQPLADWLGELGLPPETLLVEHNGRALLRSEWAEVRLANGDRLEILRVVAGG